MDAGLIQSYPNCINNLLLLEIKVFLNRISFLVSRCYFIYKFQPDWIYSILIELASKGRFISKKKIFFINEWVFNCHTFPFLSEENRPVFRPMYFFSTCLTFNLTFIFYYTECTKNVGCYFKNVFLWKWAQKVYINICQKIIF